MLKSPSTRSSRRAHVMWFVSALDRLHRWALSQSLLLAATPCLRVLLALGFIPPGLTKVVGHRFTSLGVDTQVGYFFDAFFTASVYYQFVGAAQVCAGVLLLLPRTSLLGALIYLAISGFPNEQTALRGLCHSGFGISHRVRNWLGMCAGMSRSPTVK